MNHSALARIQSSLRAAAARNRETARFGPFLATASPVSDIPFLNYAIPDEGARPAPGDVKALVSYYQTRNRRPRFEYTPDLAPAVEPALLAAGFEVESRVPLMVFRSPKTVAAPRGASFVEPTTAAEVCDLLSVLNEAYGGPPPTDADVERQLQRIEEGTIGLLASIDGEPAGGGFVVPPEDGLAEVASIGVRLPFRRRGLAASITARLTTLALERGVDLPFLMAASDAEARIYARVGYEKIGEVLFISC